VVNSRDLLRLNVGFIIHETIGYARDFPFEIPELQLPDLEIKKLFGVVRVTRTAQGLFMQAKMKAESTLECVRCLTPFPQILEVDFADLYAFTRNSVTESNLLVPETGKIDLAPILRDEMLLAFPIKPLCTLNCKGLCPVCGENLNEITCDHNGGDADS